MHAEAVLFTRSDAIIAAGQGRNDSDPAAERIFGYATADAICVLLDIIIPERQGGESR